VKRILAWIALTPVLIMCSPIILFWVFLYVLVQSFGWCADIAFTGHTDKRSAVQARPPRPVQGGNMAAPDMQVEILGNPDVRANLVNGSEAILTENLLQAAVTLVASGNYTTKAAVDVVMELNDLLVERTKGTY
jgi:hypothetical protein